VIRPTAGSIVLVDWRRGSLPKEPDKLRPAIVVEDSRLFDEQHPNLIVVPLTTDAGFAIPALSVTIEPTRENGCKRRSYALAFNVTTVSFARTKLTQSRIAPPFLESIRQKIAVCVGAG